eukprot:m.65365 g.65365  ORF g.65365 m.65365 type:complete len:155 (+) comp15916_c0_seq3:185-649(+)
MAPCTAHVCRVACGCRDVVLWGCRCGCAVHRYHHCRCCRRAPPQNWMLPDLSSTDEEEDSEEDTARPDTGSGTTAAADGDLESAPAPSSVPGSMFSRLADALAAPGASTADSGKQGSTNANDDAAVPATFTVVSGSAEGSDDDFSEFMGPEKTD